jgi:hypothetical protein
MFSMHSAQTIFLFHISVTTIETTFKMRFSSFLFAFLIASTSAFAPLAKARRSNSDLTLAGQAVSAVKASPVKATDKATPPGKKQKASPPMKGAPPAKSSPMKASPPAKASPMKGGRPKASLITVTPVKKGAVKEMQPKAKKLFGIF